MKNTSKINEIIEAAQDLDEKGLALTLSYFKSIKWISANPGKCPAAEQKHARIQDIINGKTDGSQEEVATLTADLENCIAAATWNLKK